MLRTRHTLATSLIACALGGSAHADPVAFNTTLVAHEPMAPATDISAVGDIVIVGREALGITILDVSDADDPVVLTTWDHPSANLVVRDPRPSGTILWCTNETSNDPPFGCFALDITNPASPVLLNELGPPTFPAGVHNLWPDGTDLYLSGTAPPSGNFILDVSNPLAPSVRARIQRSVHDNSVVGDSLYYAAGYEGLFLYDVTDPDTPIERGVYASPGIDTTYYAHNAYPISGTPYVVLTEEVQKPIGSPLEPGSTRIVDFSDPMNPVALWRYRSETQKTSEWVGPHNAYVVGEFMYLSHYHDGVKIFDVSVPDDPVEVGFYDTYPDLPSQLFQGCWGVYPFQGPDRIFLSDRTYGYFHVAFDGARRTELNGFILDASTLDPIPGAIFTSVTAARTTAPDASGAYVFQTGSGLHQIQVSAAGYIPQALALELGPNGVLTRDFLLEATAVDVPESTPLDRLAVRIAPNPTAGIASVRYDVPIGAAGARLDVGIYDVRGRRIRALVSATAVPGAHTATWDGRSDAGFRVAAGVYVVRTRVGEETATERLVIRR